MFCPNCIQTHSEDLNRCPVCGGDLTSKIPLSIEAQKGESSLSTEGHGAEATHSVGEESSPVLQTAIPPVVEPPPSPQAPTSAASEASPSLQAPTPAGGEPPPSPQAIQSRNFRAVAAAAVFALFLGFAVYKNKTEPVSTMETPVAQQSQAELKAAVWLDGARKSIQAKEFDIAVSQFEKGLTLMPGDGASNQEISKVKAEYGGALESDGQWEEALTVWRELADSDPEALAQASRVEKALRREASALLEKSQKHLQEGELTRAEQAATEAHRLLTSFGGADAAIALSLQRLAQVHIELGRPVKAESELKQAQRLAYTLEREELLSTLAPKASKKVDRPAAVRPKRAAVRKPPSLGEPDSIPKATAKTRATNSETQPVRRRRMVEIPAARPPSDDEAESDLPLGQRDVVKGYRNSR